MLSLNMEMNHLLFHKVIGLVAIMLFQLNHMSTAQQHVYEPDEAVTARVKVIDYERTGHHVSSGKITLKIMELVAGSTEDSVLRFERLENRYLVDKIFGQKADQSEILSSEKTFVVKYILYPDDMSYEGKYQLIWSARTERRASLEKLESLLRAFMNKLDDTMSQEFEATVLLELKREDYGRFFFSHNDTSYVYFETFPGSTAWILALQEEGYLRSSEMSAELLKTEREGRIFYEKDGIKKIAIRQNPDSNYWWMATIRE